MTTIPASAFVAVTPSVLSAGGNEIDLLGLLVTTNPRVPIGAVQSFPSQLAVANFFGPTSNEALAAAKYFAGYQGAQVLPGAMLVTQYPLAAVGAYLRGGNISALTLAQLQALSGTLNVAIDGVPHSAPVSLAAANSFSAAANIIGNSLGIQGAQVAQVTGSIGGTTLTVQSVISGAPLVVGDVVGGTGVVGGTYITAFLSGTGAAGTYTVSQPQSAPTQTITAFLSAVQFDSVSGAFTIYSATAGPGSTLAYASGAMATSLLLTQATGAVLSQGAAAATPGPFMAAVTVQTQNWASFMLLFDPDQGVGNAQKVLFSQWTSSTNNRYAFICWDLDQSAAATAPATGSLGFLIGPNGANYSGTCWLPASIDFTIAAFVMGYIASVDFEQTNGRADAAYRQQAGLIANVTTQAAMSNIIANGGSFYGAVGGANQNFVYFFNGQISGPFLWLDSYINQIWMNAQFQTALLTLLTTVLSIPYNAAGAATIEAGLATVIQAALNFGAIRAGVTLSSTQAAAVNLAAGGRNIAAVIQSRGWYLLVLPATPQVRAARQSPPVTFFYADGQSVQTINMGSVSLL